MTKFFDIRKELKLERKTLKIGERITNCNSYTDFQRNCIIETGRKKRRETCGVMGKCKKVYETKTRDKMTNNVQHSQKAKRSLMISTGSGFEHGYKWRNKHFVCKQVHSWDTQARAAHSINGCRHTHTQRQTAVHPCLRTTLGAVRGRENTHTQRAVTCLPCYILLYIESFSQLAPKNKHSSVCPHRWTRRTRLHGQLAEEAPIQNQSPHKLPRSRSEDIGGLFTESLPALLTWAVTVYMLLCCWLGTAGSLQLHLAPPLNNR